MPKLLNNPLASCSFINLDFVLPHTAHFDDIIVLPFLVFNTFRSIFSVLFLHFKQYYSLQFDYVAYKNNDIRLAGSWHDLFFKNVNFLATHSSRLDACLITLFVSINFLGAISPLCFLQPNEYVHMFCNDAYRKLTQHRFLLLINLVVFY